MLQKFLYLLTLPVAILGIIFSNSTPVAALEVGDLVMSISPSEQVIELTPGQHYEGSVTVSNVGRLAFNFTLEAAPYHVNDDTYDPDFSTDSSYTNLKNWLKFPESNYRLEPGHSVDAKFVVDVPEDAPSGGQYAAIMIQNSPVKPQASELTSPSNLDQTPGQTQTPNQTSSSDETKPAGQDDTSNAPLDVKVRAAAVLYGHVVGGELRETGELTAHELPRLALGNTFSAASTIKNDGNVDFYARQTLSIRNFFTNNEILQPAEDGSTTPFTGTLIVLPGTSRTSVLRWGLADTGTFPIGLYRVTQTVVFLDQTHTFEQLLFVCPIWLALLLVFLVALLVIWLILGLAKRRKTKRENATF